MTTRALTASTEYLCPKVRVIQVEGFVPIGCDKSCSRKNGVAASACALASVIAATSSRGDGGSRKYGLDIGRCETLDLREVQ
eukprot:scaffold185550_cov33-Tisochrysis_lutea.AAC.1